MTVVFEGRFARTLDVILGRFGDGRHRGTRLEAWLFEGEAARRAAEARLREAGVEARLRCAYKPLVHAFLEDIDLSGLDRIEIAYPVHPAADPLRFRLESYPLAALVGEARLTFAPAGEELVYRVRAEGASGALEREVFAPNKRVPNGAGGFDLTPTGWLRVRPRGEADQLDEPMETEIEALFGAAVMAVEGHAWPAEPPFFERLSIRAAVPALARELPVGEEVIDTAEALHEDLYFTLLERFRRRAGGEGGDRTLQPGQIVPEVTTTDGAATLRIALESYGAEEDEAQSGEDIETCGRAPAPSTIRSALSALPGIPVEGVSREGRTVAGIYRAGRDPGVLITAGQHANETSGIVGALRAARRLWGNPEAQLAAVPLENPDGYAVHRRLCATHPRHMHHAARYSARGNDIDQGPSETLSEFRVRGEAAALSGAGLHVNLHGYPAHEWTRPFTGYLPRGFEQWSLPKGFLVILRYHPGYADPGRRLVAAVAVALSAVPGLTAFNARQIALCEAHGGHVPGERIDGIPCLFAEDRRHPMPLTLITEFPDETVIGDAFRFAHTVQMAAAVAAVAAYVTIAGEAPAA